MKFELIHSCIDHTGEYWYSEYTNDNELYEAGFSDHGFQLELKEFKTKENAIKWLEKMRKEN